MNMTDIFYYMGIPCFILCVIAVIRLFYSKKEEDLSTSKRIDMINEGSEIAFTFGKEATKEFVVDNLQKINPFTVFIAIFDIIWIAIGIIVSEQKILFILMFIIQMFSVQITTAITKDKKKQIYCEYVNSIISFLLITAILYNHFFNSIN